MTGVGSLPMYLAQKAITGSEDFAGSDRVPVLPISSLPNGAHLLSVHTPAKKIAATSAAISAVNKIGLPKRRTCGSETTGALRGAWSVDTTASPAETDFPSARDFPLTAHSKVGK